MRTALMVFASDLVDEGFATVVDRARDRGGFDGIELAAIYHHARDVHPHNPVHRVRFLDGGALFFRPDRQAFAGQRIQPHLAAMLADVDPLRRLLDVASERDMAVRSWTITLHNSTLGERYPDATAENAFGDRLLTDLCPANPDARAYARTVTAELAHTAVAAIVAESICFMPFDHGFHHERTPYPLSETVRFFLSLCFCQHCRARAAQAGASVERLHDLVRGELDHALAGDASLFDDVPLTREAVAALAGGEMGALLAARQETVASLVAEITDAVENAGPSRFVFMDSMGADEGADQVGPFVADRSWRFGIDLAEIARSCHGLAIMGYSRDDHRFRADLHRYREIVPPGTPLSLVLRALPPHCYGVDDLRPKLLMAEAAGIEWAECFVYGLMRLEGLDWFREARRERGRGEGKVQTSFRMNNGRLDERREQP
jgi:hypothetical protein